MTATPALVAALEAEPEVTFEGTTFYYRTAEGTAAYTHTYYLGVLYGHPGAEKRSAFLVRSGRALDALSFRSLLPALSKVLGEGKPITVEIFRRLIDE